MHIRCEGRFFKSRTFWMLVAFVTLVIGFSADRIDVSSALAQSPLATSALVGSGSGGLISHFQQAPNGGPTRVILIDPVLKRIVVYDVAMDSGAIQLKSVRNFSVDLQVQEYNSGDPSPINMEKTLQRN